MNIQVTIKAQVVYGDRNGGWIIEHEEDIDYSYVSLSIDATDELFSRTRPDGDNWGIWILKKLLKKHSSKDCKFVYKSHTTSMMGNWRISDKQYGKLFAKISKKNGWIGWYEQNDLLLEEIQKEDQINQKIIDSSISLSDLTIEAVEHTDFDDVINRYLSKKKKV